MLWRTLETLHPRRGRQPAQPRAPLRLARSGRLRSLVCGRLEGQLRGFFEAASRCRLTRYQSRQRRRSRPPRLDAPETGNARNYRDCRDGACSSGGAGADPEGGLQSVPLETNRFSTASRRTKPLAARFEDVADKFLGLLPWPSLTGIAFATGAVPCLHGFLLLTTIRSPVNLSVKSSARPAWMPAF